MNQIKSNINGRSNLDCLSDVFHISKYNYFYHFHNKDNPKDKKMKEVWKPIEGYEGLYEISNYGEVKSFYGKKERILKYGIDSGGYSFVNLFKNGKVKTYQVSHLVWDHFGDRSRNGRKLQVDHINNNKQKNWIINLQLLTNRENTSKGYIQNGGTSSQYIGVSWSKCAKKWVAQILTDGKRKYLGLFKNEHQAHLAYQNALKGINNGGEECGGV